MQKLNLITTGLLAVAVMGLSVANVSLLNRVERVNERLNAAIEMSNENIALVAEMDVAQNGRLGTLETRLEDLILAHNNNTEVVLDLFMGHEKRLKVLEKDMGDKAINEVK